MYATLRSVYENDVQPYLARWGVWVAVSTSRLALVHCMQTDSPRRRPEEKRE